jgi:hypothetical protein
MKIFRVLLLVIFVFCTAESFWKKPFEQELPLLLFPEKKAWLTYTINLSNTGYLWDDRPLCLQTPSNFSELTPLILPQTSELLTRFRTEIVKATDTLGAKHWELKAEERKSDKKLIWPCRHIKPITPQLRFSVEKNQQKIYSFKVSYIGNSPGKNSFYSISDKTGWISFIYKEKSWPIIKSFVQQTNIPLGISKIRQD